MKWQLTVVYPSRFNFANCKILDKLSILALLKKAAVFFVLIEKKKRSDFLQSI